MESLAPDDEAPLAQARALIWAMVPVPQLLGRLQLDVLSGVDAQRWLLDNALLCPSRERFPGSPLYDSLLCKRLLGEIEARRGECDERLLALYAEASAAAASAAPMFWRLYQAHGDASVGAGVDPIAIRVLRNYDEVGLATWPAGFSLADTLLDNAAAYLSGRHVVELGAGVGFTGIALLKARADFAHLSLSDSVPSVVENMRVNLAANGFGDESTRISTAVFNWNDSDAAAEALLAGPHGAAPAPPLTILAADCLYDRDEIPSLVRFLERALAAAPKGSLAIQAITERNKETLSRFLAALESSSVVVVSVVAAEAAAAGCPPRRYRYAYEAEAMPVHTLLITPRGSRES